MPDDPTPELLDALARLLEPHLERSPDLRRALRLLGLWLVDRADRAEPLPDVAPSTDDVPDRAPADRPLPASEIEARPPTGTVPLRLGDAHAEVTVAGTVDELDRARHAAPPSDQTPPDLDTRDVDLHLVSRRLALKIESMDLHLRWCRSPSQFGSKAGYKHRCKELISRAKKLPDCFLWVFFPSKGQPNPADAECIRDCYRALRDAVDLMLLADRPGVDSPTVEQAMQLLAQASSALRVALERHTWLDRPDVDQDDVHTWLKRETLVRRVFLQRHMKLDDPAAPADAADLIDRIAALRQDVQQAIDRAKRVDNLLGKVRYHAERLAGDPDAEPDGHDLGTIDAAVEELASLGVPPADDRLASALRPAAATLRPHRPELFPRPREDPPPPPPTQRAWSDSVLRVRDLLAGRTIVVIGGVRKPDVIDRMRDAFAADVNWLELNEHASGQPIESAVPRPEVGLVVVLVKLTGHLHADVARAASRKANKPLVNMPAGFNPEQIAAEVLNQCSETLAAARA